MQKPSYLALSLVALSSGCYLTVSPPEDAAVDAPVADAPRCPTGVGALSVERSEELGVREFPTDEIPLTAEEEGANRVTGRASQIVVWPLGRARVAGGPDLVYYGRFVARPGFLNFDSLDVGVAEAPAGVTVARARSGPIFTAPEPLYGSGTVTDEGYVYAYACGIDGFLDAQCTVARVPVESARDRGRYTFFDGRAWSTDISRAAEIVRGIKGMTVRYNPHLGRFLAVYGGIVSDEIFLRTAPRPEGPWGAPVAVPSVVATARGVPRFNFNARMIDAPEGDPGCVITLGYAHPLSEESTEARALRVTLR